MTACELAGLAGVVCRMRTQPAPAAAAAVSQLARIAADMIVRPGGSAAAPSANHRDLAALEVIIGIANTPRPSPPAGLLYVPRTGIRTCGMHRPLL